MTIQSLNNYFKKVKNNLDLTKPVTVVLGNEASDLDSMASSVIFANHLAEINEDDSRTYLQVMNIPRVDFKLRTEAVFVFNEGGVNLDNLLFLDDIDMEKLASNNDVQLVLVDHNKVGATWEAFGKNVDTIIDHHADENAHLGAKTRIIEPVGSAISLVAREVMAKNPMMLDSKIAKFVMGTILLDTVNLDPKAERVTPTDEDVYRKLSEVCPLSQQEYFDQVQFEKFNVSNLGTMDLLRKDYKQWQLDNLKCGIASVLLKVSDWSDKDSTMSAKFSNYAQANNLDVLFAMIAYTDPGFKRELVVFSENKDLYNKTVEFLKGTELGLTPIEVTNQTSTGETNMSFYAQSHLGMSRKKLWPILKEFYSKN
ncbi:MAG: DHH family phosphoesterase [Bacteriovoracaceae bacterium]|nr:DHH family phosphoesterase [Bacteriovoracaceae bacterium]